MPRQAIHRRTGRDWGCKKLQTLYFCPLYFVLLAYNAPVRYVLMTLAAILLMPLGRAEAATSLTLRHKHFVFTINPRDMSNWERPQEVWLYRGQEAVPPSEFRADGDVPPLISDGWEKQKKTGWDNAAIAQTVRDKVSSTLDRPAGSVIINRTGSGIVFEGVGMPGRKVEVEATVELITAALATNATDIWLPIEETQPQITVNDPELIAKGIKEVVTVGESDFSGSPNNRRHNIAVGLAKFNGHLIAQGENFSFNAVLGKVDGSTGYLRELVIKGDRTVPDYGGGLCQVSSTAYRGIWEYGFPITQRRNHSYAVGYYAPQGSDATVYPGSIDMKFLNDGPSALLMQTYQENSHAYFIYYGTKDARTSAVFGPYISNMSAPPPDKTVYTTDLPPGERRKLGERHAGMNATWFRQRTTSTGGIALERVFSVYQARPLFYEVGVESLPDTGSGAVEPAFIDAL